LADHVDGDECQIQGLGIAQERLAGSSPRNVQEPRNTQTLDYQGNSCPRDYRFAA
jgi:hypothetical protein